MTAGNEQSFTTSATSSTSSSSPGLVRAVGRWDLVALVINGIVGAGIFGLPAKVYALIGPWSIVAIIACAVLIGIVVLCFAEVSSRFTETGGPYLYTAEAFGPFTAFVVGWLLWLARIAGICAIAGILAEYLSFLVPSVGSGVPRALMLSSVIVAFTALHVSGVKRTVRFGNLITIAKLVPLFLFVIIGLPNVEVRAFDFSMMPERSAFSSAVLLLAFAFVGWETALVAAGELRDPRRDTPFALLAGLAGVAFLYVGIQMVCITSLPELAKSSRPLADAAVTLIGPIGGTAIVIGASVSILGTLNGGMLTISRIPFAMAEAGQIPRVFASLHPVFRTPVPSILLSTLVVLALTLTSTHVYVLTISTIARLIVFAVTCAALPVLRKRERTLPAKFTLVGGVTIPVAAFALIAWLLASTSGRETRDVLVATGVGALIYIVLKRQRYASAVENR